MIFSCTGKVIKRMSSVNQISEVKYEVSPDNWCVDQLVLERKKFFLFTNSKTLFSFLVNFGTKKQVLNFNSTFAKAYKEQIIRLYGLKNDYFKIIDEDLRIINFSKTNSRSILGSMNDFKINTTSRIQQDGLNVGSLNSVNYYLNQMPMGALQYKSPYVLHSEEVQV